MSVLARRRRDEQFARERELVAMRDAVVLATTRGGAGRRIVGDARGRRRGPRAARLGPSPSRGDRAGQGDSGSSTRAAGCSTSSAPRTPSSATRPPSTSTVGRSRSACPAIRTRSSKTTASPGAYGRSSASCMVSNASGPRRGIARSCRRCPRARNLAGCPMPWAGRRRRRRRPHNARGAAWARSSRVARTARSAPSSVRCLTASSRPAAATVSELLEHDGFEAIVFHVVGCEDCWAAWHSRRRPMLARPLAILAFPVDAIATAAHSFAGKLAGLTAAATTSVLGRLGIGGAAAAGGGAATIGTKTAAVCVGVVCAATAGGEIAGVLPILHERTPKTQDATAAKPEKAIAPAQTQTQTQTSAVRNAAPTTPSPVRSAAPITATRTRPQARTTTTQAPVVPGDLPVARAVRSSSTPTRPLPRRRPACRRCRCRAASSPTASSPSSAPSRSATTTAPRDQPDCVPGDLGC